MTIESSQTNIETVLLSEGKSSLENANKNGIFYWNLNLLSKGFSGTNSKLAVSGIGAVFSLELNTTSASGILPGVYVYADEIGKFKCIRAEVSTNLTETSQRNNFIVASDAVTTTGTGLRQVVEVHLVCENGEIITASYSYCNLFN